MQEGNLLPRQHYTLTVHKQHSYLLPNSIICYQHLAGYHEVLGIRMRRVCLAQKDIRKYASRKPRVSSGEAGKAVV